MWRFQIAKTHQGFPGGLNSNESACSAGNLGSILVSGRSPGEGNGHSNILVWRIPWTEEPGRLWSMGLQRVEYRWKTNTFTKQIQQTRWRAVLAPLCRIEENENILKGSKEERKKKRRRRYRRKRNTLSETTAKIKIKRQWNEMNLPDFQGQMTSVCYYVPVMLLYVNGGWQQISCICNYSNNGFSLSLESCLEGKFERSWKKI